MVNIASTKHSVCLCMAIVREEELKMKFCFVKSDDICPFICHFMAALINYFLAKSAVFGVQLL